MTKAKHGSKPDEIKLPPEIAADPNMHRLMKMVDRTVSTFENMMDAEYRKKEFDHDFAWRVSMGICASIYRFMIRSTNAPERDLRHLASVAINIMSKHCIHEIDDVEMRRNAH